MIRIIFFLLLFLIVIDNDYINRDNGNGSLMQYKYSNLKNYIKTGYFLSTLVTTVFPYLAMLMNHFEHSWIRIMIRITTKI